MSAVPGSVLEPAKEMVPPSAPVRFGPALAVGATLAMVAVVVPLPAAPPLSVTVRVTV